MLGLVLAGALWIWLSSIAVLLGGVLNAEVDAARPRARRAEPSVPVAA
jgi:membrane protein